ncbi:MAG: biotin synthase BioB [Methylacidiphilales bacterium]|nr:biotin synthase BioB [Candidatus Methylacidiphilales bacterium]MDW8349965.1 biotin synthase BioB [Verrucomicrobiae bacterium]
MTTLAELQSLYELPFFELVTRSRQVFLEHWKQDAVQLCSLLSIKTGGCSEDCAYCSQSAHYQTGITREELMNPQDVIERAKAAKAAGATRFCMGAAWRGVSENDSKLQPVLEMVRGVAALGMEVCVTLGNLTPRSAQMLKEAGVTAYNHNLDTSPDFYPKIVTTHTYQDRLNTIRHASAAGMAICSGGIIGMGETIIDRLKMLEVLASFDPPPESLPINCLQPIPGTPLADQPPVDPFELIRLIAVARITFPRTRIRLSAGRTNLSRETQAWCFFAGANSIFFGGKLLTAKNPSVESDYALFETLGIKTCDSNMSSPASEACATSCNLSA